MSPAGLGQGREAECVNPAPFPGPFLRCSAGRGFRNPMGLSHVFLALAFGTATAGRGKGAEQRSCHPEPRASQRPRGPLGGPMGQGSKPGWEEGRPFLPGACLRALETYEPWLPICLPPCPVTSPAHTTPIRASGWHRQSLRAWGVGACGGHPRCAWCPPWASPGLLSTLGPPKVGPSQQPLEDTLAPHPSRSSPAPHPVSLRITAARLIGEVRAGARSGPFLQSLPRLPGDWTRRPSFSLLKVPLRPALRWGPRGQPPAGPAPR